MGRILQSVPIHSLEKRNYTVLGRNVELCLGRCDESLKNLGIWDSSKRKPLATNPLHHLSQGAGFSKCRPPAVRSPSMVIGNADLVEPQLRLTVPEYLGDVTPKTAFPTSTPGGSSLWR